MATSLRPQADLPRVPLAQHGKARGRSVPLRTSRQFPSRQVSKLHRKDTTYLSFHQVPDAVIILIYGSFRETNANIDTSRERCRWQTEGYDFFPNYVKIQTITTPTSYISSLLLHSLSQLHYIATPITTHKYHHQPTSLHSYLSLQPLAQSLHFPLPPPTSPTPPLPSSVPHPCNSPFTFPHTSFIQFSTSTNPSSLNSHHNPSPLLTSVGVGVHPEVRVGTAPGV